MLAPCRRHTHKCGWLAKLKLCFVVGLVALSSSAANEVVRVAVGDDGSVDEAFARHTVEGAARTRSTTAGGDRKSPASVAEELQFGRPKGGRRRRARSTLGIELPQDTSTQLPQDTRAPSSMNEKNLGSVAVIDHVDEDDNSQADTSGGVSKRQTSGNEPKLPADKSATETSRQPTLSTTAVDGDAAASASAGAGAGTGIGIGGTAAASSPSPRSRSEQEFGRSGSPRKAKRSHFGFVLPPEFRTSGNEGTDGAGTIGTETVDVLVANGIVGLIAVLVVIVFAVIGLMQVRKAGSSVRLRSRGVLDVRAERAQIFASKLSLRASVSSDAVAVGALQVAFLNVPRPGAMQKSQCLDDTFANWTNAVSYVVF